MSLYDYLGRDLYSLNKNNEVATTPSPSTTTGAEGMPQTGTPQTTETVSTSETASENFTSGELQGDFSIVDGFIESKGFVSGSIGWRINADGSAEFSDGVFRGTLTASSIDIPNTTTANSFHVDSDGNAWWGATTLAAGVAWVKKDGSALFTSGTIGGTTMTSTTLVVGTGANAITIDSSTGSISSNGSAWILNGSGTTSGLSKIATSVVEVNTHSTSTEQTILSVAIPANTLGTSNVVKFKIVLSDIDTSTTARTITLRLKYDNTTIVTIVIQDSSATISNFNGIIEGYLMGAGTTSSQRGYMSYIIGDEDIRNGFGLNEGASAEDSTGALNLVVTAQNTFSGVSDGLRMEHYVVDKIT